MRKTVLLVLMLVSFVHNVMATSVHGITVEPSVKIGEELLQLNGYGMRKKFFLNIYLGSFYTAEKVSDTDQALQLNGGKLIRMNFIYSRVQRLNILGAFVEGFKKNTPELSGSPEVKTFISWFKNDFVEGDVVDLVIDREGTVTAIHNFKQIGSMHSPELAKGIVLIYLGKHPADEKMKQGMLGKNS